MNSNGYYTQRYVSPQDLWTHFGFKEGGIRWWLFNRHTNGLNAAVHKVGRSLLIDLEAFQAWIESHKG